MVRSEEKNKGYLFTGKRPNQGGGQDKFGKRPHFLLFFLHPSLGKNVTNMD